MSKIAAIVFAAVALLFWFRVTFFRRSVAELKTIPTGVSKVSYFIVALFFFLGPWFATMSITKLITELQREQAWTATVGEVYAHQEAGTSKGRVKYRTSFRFKDENGVEREGSSEESTVNPPAIGSTVKVLYDPVDPGAAEIDDGFYRFGFNLALIAFGLFATTFAVLASLQVIKLQKLSMLALSAAGRGTGTFVKSKRNWLLSLRHRPSYRIIVEYTDLAGRKYLTESEPIWDTDPKEWARTEVPVPLSMNPADTSMAWVRVQDYFLACKR